MLYTKLVLSIAVKLYDLMIMKTILKKFREKVKIYLKKLFILTKYFK